jgi:hypothetical protein
MAADFGRGSTADFFGCGMTAADLLKELIAAD